MNVRSLSWKKPSFFVCIVTSHTDKRHCDPAEVSTSGHTEEAHDTKFTFDLTMLCELEV